MIKLKNILLPILESSQYLGSCVDIDSENGSPICDIFPDATTMAQAVGDPDFDDPGDSKELSQSDFFRYINRSTVPQEAMKGEHSYHYIAEYDIRNRRELTLEEAEIFFIYNSDSDIHYFFSR